MSLASDRRAPAFCLKDGISAAEMPACEAFLVAPAGSPRERATVYWNLGYAYFYFKDKYLKHQFASEAWDKAIAEDPTFAEPHISQGDAIAMGENKQMALPFYERAQALDAKNWRAFMGPAKVRLELGQAEDAIALARKALEIAPDVGVAHQIYGRILERAGRFPDALQEYRKATAVFDGNMHREPGLVQEPSPWNALANLELKMGRPANAVKAISRVIDGLPENAVDPNNLVSRAEYFEAAGRYGEAAADLERAVALFGPSFDFYELDKYRARAAMLKAKAGNGAAAKDAFRDILKSGKLRSILRIQVFLRNSGFTEVVIDGKVTPALEKALDHCLTTRNCAEALGQPI